MLENSVDKLIAIEFYEEEESYTSNHEHYHKDNGWQLDYLNIHEQKILALLRSKKYETVIVHFKNEAISTRKEFKRMLDYVKKSKEKVSHIIV